MIHWILRRAAGLGLWNNYKQSLPEPATGSPEYTPEKENTTDDSCLWRLGNIRLISDIKDKRG